MNVKELFRLRNSLATLPAENFDMGAYGVSQSREYVTKNNQTSRGTTCCIAGHYLLMNGYMFSDFGNVWYDKTGKSIDPSDEAARLLGLTSKQSLKLFYLSEWRDDFTAYTATPMDAVRIIERLIQTGE